MEKRVAMSLVVARLRLKRAFPIIGVPPSLEERCVNELIELAVITSNSASSNASEHQLTEFGQDVLTCSVDVHLGILETVCSRLNLRWHGRIVAAYVQTIAGVFIENNGVNTCELGPRQVATNSDAGIMAALKIRRKKFFEVNYGHLHCHAFRRRR